MSSPTAPKRIKLRTVTTYRRDGTHTERPLYGAVLESLGFDMYLVRLPKWAQAKGSYGPYQVVHLSGVRLCHSGEVESLKDFAVMAVSIAPKRFEAIRGMTNPDNVQDTWAPAQELSREALAEIARYRNAAALTAWPLPKKYAKQYEPLY